MRIGIKYCGGCRAGYNRGEDAGEVVRLLLSVGHLPEGTIVEVAEAGAHYDLLLTVCGCTNKCADISEYEHREIVYMWEPDSIESTVAHIREKIEGISSSAV
ncbi:MAG: hypothetical protein LBN34_05335 [Clostridiales Family XIII bacterium]|jgi:hypothetical protein|nr:hypothetical protein [Clostridiales Family XIII bacterium]